MANDRLRHGLFSAPYHPIDENPTTLFTRELELIEWLDRLGYQEAWIGEHHSGGWEMISSPELMIAAAAERTKHIRLGTGVVSLTYHNPLMVANRIIQLDHMTRGRVMLGVGPGVLVTDAIMNGVDPLTQRDRMAEALAVILRLLRGETVTHKTDWFDLDQARVHILPYSEPHPEVAVASVYTPSGARAAGTYGLGLLCVAATDPKGFDVLRGNWTIAEDIAAKDGRTMDRSRLRICVPMHIAETRDQARANVRFGLAKWFDYYGMVTAIPLGETKGQDAVDYLINSKRVVIGTPDDAIEMIERLQAEQGDFGCVLQLGHDWADWEQTKKSFELYARFVMPHFSNVNKNRRDTHAWMKANMAAFNATRQKAYEQMFAKHAADGGALPPT